MGPKNTTECLSAKGPASQFVRSPTILRYHKTHYSHCAGCRQCKSTVELCNIAALFGVFLQTNMHLIINLIRLRLPLSLGTFCPRNILFQEHFVPENTGPRNIFSLGTFHPKELFVLRTFCAQKHFVQAICCSWEHFVPRNTLYSGIFSPRNFLSIGICCSWNI